MQPWLAMNPLLRPAILGAIALRAMAALAGCSGAGGADTTGERSVANPATAAGLPPVAVIESGSPVYDVQDTATFDGRASHDPDGYIVDRDWRLLAWPPASVARLDPDAPGGLTSTLLVDQSGDYAVQLTVTDDSGLAGSTIFRFHATASLLHVQLAWPASYGSADLDLHLTDTTAALPAPRLWDDAFDCHWFNCRPAAGDDLEWGQGDDSTDNPRLDVDNIGSRVPENMSIEAPRDGVYRVVVHYFGARPGAVAPVDATVRVWLGAALVHQGAARLELPDDVWMVGDISWASGRGTFAALDAMGTTTYEP